MRTTHDYFNEKIYFNKDEYNDILKDNEDELNELGVIVDKKIQTQNVINSDLMKLNTDLFDLIKFENSKPYKMIDYIVHNDLTLLNPDKKKLEEIKKTVFNLKVSKKESKNDSLKLPIYKALYQQFRCDFNNSSLFKLYDKVNAQIVEKFRVSEPVNVSVKDKFTYQNYLMERMRNYSDFFGELNDHEIMKALIYLCNKNFKANSSKNFYRLSKIDSGFTGILRDNQGFLEKHSVSGFFRKYTDNITGELAKNEKFGNFVKKKFNKMFRKIANADKFDNPEERRLVVNKMIESLYRIKEDDTEKQARKVAKFERINKLSGKDNTRNIVRFWVLFRFFFCLNNLDHSKYFTDEIFWKMILDYKRLNPSYIPPPEEVKKEKPKGR
jgi:hypothetical protein